MRILPSRFRFFGCLVTLLALNALTQAQVVPFQLEIGGDVAPGPRGIRAAVFTPNLDALRRGAEQMSIVLPAGGSILVERTRFEDRGSGDALWAGRVMFEEGSSVLFTLSGGVVVGSIQRQEADYTVGTRPDGTQVLEQSNRAAPKREVLLGSADPTARSNARVFADLAASADVQVESEIDLLVLYTPAARDYLGGVPQMQAAIQNAVDYSNTVFLNSLVPAHYRLVLTRLTLDVPVQVAAPDGGNNLTTVSTSPAVSALRSETGADLVTLVTTSLHDSQGSVCGMAVAGNVVGPVTSSNFVQQFDVLCEPLGLTVAHENGHLLGMDHNPENASGFTQFPWSYGHQVPGVFHTVMSYGPCGVAGCPAIPNFSNPDVSYLGYPTGIVDQRDNARTGRINAPLVAAFRPAGPAAVPEVPAGLNAVFSNGAGVQLGWFPATYATAYDIQRSTDNVNFSIIGSSSDIHFTDPNVSSPNTYYYRVRGRNFRGMSAYSAVKTFTMPAPPAAPSGLTATALGANEIRLNWVDNANTEVGFAVEMLIGGSWELVDGADGVNVTTRTLTGLQPSTPYTFRVFVYSNDFESLRSNQASATTLATNPGGVTGYAWNDADHDGVVDKGETPAAGLVIFYDSNANGINDEVPAKAVTVSKEVKNIPGTNIPFLSVPNYLLSGLPMGGKRICASFYPLQSGKAFCRVVDVGNGTTPNVNFPVTEGRVGVSSMVPQISAVPEGDKITFSITWTDTDGRWVLLKDATIRFAKADGKDAMQILFDEASRTFSLVDKDVVGPGSAAGSPIIFETHDATFYLQESAVLGTGPTGPSVTLRLVMAFNPSARGPLDVQLKLTDDQGYVQGFDSLGQVTVVKKK